MKMKFLKHLILAVMMMPLFSSCNYNSLVEKNQQVEQSWAEVQNQYQRRSDLIPNLVATVKGYATHESETLEKVTQARAPPHRSISMPRNSTRRLSPSFRRHRTSSQAR